MAKRKRDTRREDRIFLDILADAHDLEEQAVGWYEYLEDTLAFPFTATCIAERAISPCRKGDKVEAVEMGPQDECRHEMFVSVRWEGRALAVPLSQLNPAPRTDQATREAVADWHYWVAHGHEL